MLADVGRTELKRTTACHLLKGNVGQEQYRRFVQVADDGHTRSRFFGLLHTAGEHHPPTGNELRQLVEEHPSGTLLLHRLHGRDDSILPRRQHIVRVAREIPVGGGAVGPLLGAKLLTDYDPNKAEYDDKGRLIGRPMLVPAVGDGLEALTYPPGKRPAKRRAVDGELDWFEDEEGELFPGFTAVRRKRSGMFTPVAAAPTPTAASADEEIVRERQTYADDMRGEEMEEHIADVARSTSAKSGGTAGSERIEGAAGRLEKSAEALERAAGSLVGSLRISGSADVSSVMGDVMRLLGGRGTTGVDHLTVAGLMARAVGMTPLDNGKPPVREDLARFGLFVDSAARLGLSPEQTERVGREVKETPDRRLTPDTRAELVESAVTSGRSRDEAEREVNRLEIAARLLPNEINAFGSMPVPSVTVEPEVKVEPIINVSTDDQDSDYDAAMRSSAAMSGSQAVLGGTE